MGLNKNELTVISFCERDLIEQTLGQSRFKSLFVKNDVLSDGTSAFYSLLTKLCHFF